MKNTNPAPAHDPKPIQSLWLRCLRLGRSHREDEHKAAVLALNEFVSHLEHLAASRPGFQREVERRCAELDAAEGVSFADYREAITNE